MLHHHLSVIHQTLTTTLAAKSRLLVSAERRRRIELVEGVCPDDACLEQRTHLQDPRTLVGPDSGRQSVHRIVGFLYRFFERAECKNAQHRSEDFLAGDAVTLRYTRENRGLEVVAAARERARRGLIHFGASAYAGVDQFADPVELRLGIDRANIGVLVERIPHPQYIDAVLQLRDEHLGDRLLDKQSAAGAADMALIEEDAVYHPFNRLVHR